MQMQMQIVHSPLQMELVVVNIGVMSVWRLPMVLGGQDNRSPIFSMTLSYRDVIRPLRYVTFENGITKKKTLLTFLLVEIFILKSRHINRDDVLLINIAINIFYYVIINKTSYVLPSSIKNVTQLSYSTSIKNMSLSFFGK